MFKQALLSYQERERFQVLSKEAWCLVRVYGLNSQERERFQVKCSQRRAGAW